MPPKSKSHPRRRIGQDGPDVYPIGVGAMSFTPFYGPVTEEQSLAILGAAMDMGVDHIDTSNVYGMGQSETVIGKYIKDNGQTARDFFRIATKGGIDRSREERAIDNSPEHLAAALDASLERLGVERVDLYYVHRRDASVPIEDVVGTLKGFVDSGKIGGFGFSEIAPTSLRKAHSVHPVAAVQSEYSLSTRIPDLGMVQATADVGATMVAFSPVGRSLLTDSPIQYEKAKDLGFLKGNPRFSADTLAANHAAAEGFRSLAAEMGMPASRLALAWLLHRGDHVLPIPGTRSVEHFREMVPAAETVLTDSDLAAVDKALPPGWAHGDRYSEAQWKSVERYC